MALEGEQTHTVQLDIRYARSGGASIAYQVVGFEAHGAGEEGGAVRVQQRLYQSVFGTAFTTHFNRVRQGILTEARRRELLG